MKYYIIAGEASGDLHGATLINAIQNRDPESHIRAWGGDRMEQAGAYLVRHYRDLDYMGFWEVLTNLPAILGNLRSCKKDIEAYRPDALILIDYPGFNLRIAKWASKHSFQVFYYISPQLWAWKENRVNVVRNYVDRMFVILPFEQSFYAKHDIDVTYVGHPLLDVVEDYQADDQWLNRHATQDKKIVALLPGSRKQEIKRILPIMLEAIRGMDHLRFMIAAVPHHEESFYHQMIEKEGLNNRPELIINRTYDILSIAHAAIVVSGTASLETALFEVPECVVYRGNILSYYIAKKIVNVNYISLVNLILDRPLITELVQGEVQADIVRRELDELFLPYRRKRILEGYQSLKEKLGQSGAAQSVADEVIDRLKH